MPFDPTRTATVKAYEPPSPRAPSPWETARWSEASDFVRRAHPCCGWPDCDRFAIDAGCVCRHCKPFSPPMCSEHYLAQHANVPKQLSLL